MKNQFLKLRIKALHWLLYQKLQKLLYELNLFIFLKLCLQQ